MAEKKRGRPVKEVTKWCVIKARIDEDEYAMVDKLRASTGMTTSKILRAAIRLYYHMTFK
jgi:hypothetical protein